jgi:hypothetical protein
MWAGQGSRKATPSGRGTTGAKFAIIVSAAVVLSLAAGGVAFAATFLAQHTASSGPTVVVSLFSALTSADTAAAGVAPGGWTPIAAAGLAPHTAVSFPGPEYVPSYNCSTEPPSPEPLGGNPSAPPCLKNSTGPSFSSPCVWTAQGGANLTSNQSIVVPAMTSSVGTGLAPFWAIEYVGGPNFTLFVIVLDGVATPYATFGGPGCGPSLTNYTSLVGSVVDSVTAAGIVNAWGGTAFLANSTNVSAVYGVEAAATYHGYSGGCGNATPLHASSSTTGTCQNATYAYSTPATWFLEYSSCGFPLLPYGLNCHSPGVLTAELNGSTGAPIFVTISMQWQCGWVPVCIYGPVAQGAPGPAPAVWVMARPA